jgi:MoaA/NifB/PqqE/SkfB family radical SAM enzyme
MILRAKTDALIETRELTGKQVENTVNNKREMVNNATTLQAKPQRLVFELTNSCNLNCVMCGRNSKHFKPTTFNTDWLQKFDDVADHVEEVTLMGWGEPTMHPQFTKFLQWAHYHKLRKYFCTNGMKLDHFLNPIFDLQVDVVAVSIDAANSELNEKIRRGSKLGGGNS